MPPLHARSPRLIGLVLLLFTGLAAPLQPSQARRLRAAAPAPAPASALDAASGGGGGDGCVGAAMMLPAAGPTLADAARGLLEQCGVAGASQEDCGAAGVNATYTVAAVYALTLSLTAAEEAINRECALQRYSQA